MGLTDRLKNATLKTIILGGLLVGISQTSGNLTREPIYINYITKLTPLKLERMKGYSGWFGDDYYMMDSVIGSHNLLIGIDSLVSEETRLMLQIIKENTKSVKKHNDKIYSEIYQKFRLINREINIKKREFNTYEIIQINDEYLLGKDKVASSIESKIWNKMQKYLHISLLFEEIHNEYPGDHYLNMVVETIENASSFLPIIRELNNHNKSYMKNKLSDEGLISIISNESSGMPYMMGKSRDVNMFQINIENIPNLYRRLKFSNHQSDSIYKKILDIGQKNLVDFQEEIITCPEKNIALGMYLIKEIDKEAYNEAHLILIYRLGSNLFSTLSADTRYNLINGHINNWENTSVLLNRYKQKSLESDGIRYLHRYYKKKHYAEELSNMVNEMYAKERY